ncbi:MAG: GtrA family protein [Promethearchaeota archaeon]|nr:MAG: GtrA family protein [Candidatus Lokiarchaeota archaeon]
MEQINDVKKDDDIRKQMILYFTFAIAMIILNYLIQKLNQIYIAPSICQNYTSNDFIYAFYCSNTPYNMPELIGSIIAVGITYVTKFILDKFIVFKKTTLELKETSEEFAKYFAFAIMTTIINIGIQFLLTNFLGTPLEISMLIALSVGYSIKFILDRKYVFKKVD